MLKFAAIKAPKNDVTGAPMAPDASKYTKDDLFAIASDNEPYAVKPKGYPGQVFKAGELYVGNFDTDVNKFASDLVPAPEVKLPGNVKPTGVKANDDGSISEDK